MAGPLRPATRNAIRTPPRPGPSKAADAPKATTSHTRLRKPTLTNWPPSGMVRARIPTMDLEDEQIMDVRASAPPSPPPIPRRDPTVGILATLVATRGGPWKIAATCAEEIAREFGAKTVLVHSYDGRRGDIRIIGVDGPKSHDFLGSTESAEDDFIASTLLANGKSLTLCFEGGALPRVAPERLRHVGAKKSLVAVPVRVGPAFVAMIEIVDAEEHLGRLAERCARIAAKLAYLLTAR